MDKMHLQYIHNNNIALTNAVKAQEISFSKEF